MTATITTPSPVAKTAVRTSPLLRAGIVAGPFFALAGFAQMPFRPGFDLTKHAFSFLLIGDQGWIQTMVFVVTGLLYAAAGFGLRRHLPGRVGAIAAVLAVLLGIGKIIAGLNAPQPSFGYPIGTPDGPPAALTTASILHGLGRRSRNHRLHPSSFLARASMSDAPSSGARPGPVSRSTITWLGAA
jgi:Protein of unknown function (DUF998)